MTLKFDFTFLLKRKGHAGYHFLIQALTKHRKTVGKIINNINQPGAGKQAARASTKYY